MLKLTRLLHFHQPSRVDMLDYYERTLFNQMLGEQDPTSAHGFNCYYTGLSAGAFKRQPLNYFPGGNPDVYATDHDTFTCDTATGLETPAKFADTIYSRDADGIYVNLFIPSRVRTHGLVLRQVTGFPGRTRVLHDLLAGRVVPGADAGLEARLTAAPVPGPPLALVHGLHAGDRDGVALRDQISGKRLRRRHLPGPRVSAAGRQPRHGVHGEVAG
jgi:hypothetical protein